MDEVQRAAVARFLDRLTSPTPTTPTIRTQYGVPPEGSVLLPMDVCSNFDHVIDSEVVRLLEAGGCVAGHAAWEFCGYVWYADGRWHEGIMRHHEHVDTVTAPTLPELFKTVNDKWGWD
jgi:hypothetical protein